MSDYDVLGALALRVEGYRTERRSVSISEAFERVTTTVVLTDGEFEGRGEDVTYDPLSHDAFPTDLPAAGDHTLESFSRGLDEHELPDYRRWAFESAALDLALRSADRSLGDVVDRAYRPVRFVVSTRADIRPWREHYPGLEFKIDPEVEWPRNLMEELAATGSIRVADLKGYYRGSFSGPPADARLYRDVIEVFRDAVIEDPELTGETREIVRAAEERVSFDAPIHSVRDVEALELRPRWLNMKPSRFGTCRRLFETIAYCEKHSIRMYGGGQFELGTGREQIQALASLYYPDGPNDVAPVEYNLPPPRPGLPASPLAPSGRPLGLSR